MMADQPPITDTPYFLVKYVVKEVVSKKKNTNKFHVFHRVIVIHSRSSVKVLQVIRQGFAGHPSNRENIIQVLLLERAGHPSRLGKKRRSSVKLNREEKREVT